MPASRAICRRWRRQNPAGKHSTRRIQDFRTPELGDDVLLGRTGLRGRIVERLMLD
jgi:hypothetical protein